MQRRGIIKDIALFLGVLLILLIIVPLISSVFKQLIILQLLILAIGTAVLTYIVHKVRSKTSR